MARPEARALKPYRVTSRGRTYYYAYRGRGAPRLPGTPADPEFWRAFAAAHERLVGTSALLAGLCIRYRASKEFAALGDSTRRQWRPWLDRIQNHFGNLSVGQFDRPTLRRDIKAWRDLWRTTPRTADYGLQVLSRLLSFAVGEGLLRSNICDGIPRIYRAQRADRIWSEEDLLRLEAVCTPEIAAAARLAALTGLRQGDLLALPWSAVGPLAIDIATRKSRGDKLATIPLYPKLAELVANIPRLGETVLTTTRGAPWGSGFGASWNKAMRQAGLRDSGLTFHDLRGTAATRFYVAGLSEREIAHVMGWSEVRVQRMIDTYVKRDEILRDQIGRLTAGPPEEVQAQVK